MNHSDLKAKALSDPKVKAAYDEMAPEFALLRQMRQASQIGAAVTTAHNTYEPSPRQ